MQVQRLIQTILTGVSRQQATTAVILTMMEVVLGATRRIIQTGTGIIVLFHSVQVTVSRRMTFATYNMQKQLK